MLSNFKMAHPSVGLLDEYTYSGCRPTVSPCEENYIKKTGNFQDAQWSRQVHSQRENQIIEQQLQFPGNNVDPNYKLLRCYYLLHIFHLGFPIVQCRLLIRGWLYCCNQYLRQVVGEGGGHNRTVKV